MSLLHRNLGTSSPCVYLGVFHAAILSFTSLLCLMSDKIYWQHRSCWNRSSNCSTRGRTWIYSCNCNLKGTYSSCVPLLCPSFPTCYYIRVPITCLVVLTEWWYTWNPEWSTRSTKSLQRCWTGFLETGFDPRFFFSSCMLFSICISKRQVMYVWVICNYNQWVLLWTLNLLQILM